MKLALTVMAFGFFVMNLHASPLAPTAEEAATTAAIVGDIYASGRAMDYLEVLADELGPRLTGSDQYERAVHWAVETFHGMGITDVHVEPVALDHGWRRGPAGAKLLGSDPRILHVASYGWSPPTPGPVLRAPVAFLTDTTDEAIAAAHVRGAIVLIDRASLDGPVAFRHASTEDWDREHRAEIVGGQLKAAGAIAALVYSKTANQVLRTTTDSEGGAAMPLPVAAIGHEDGLLLRRRLAKGPVEIELSLANVLTGPITVHNVVAEIPGREHPEQMVMLGAHLDSWDFATGAQDNGSGVAQVMDAARALVHLSPHPRRSLRFVLWAAEEEGENGSRAYVRAHAADLDQVVAYLNTDSGAGRPRGWNVAGRSDMSRALAPLVPVFERIGGGGMTEDDLDFDTDVTAFFLAGVPTLDLDVVDDDYDSVLHHKAADTLDKVDVHDLAAGAAMMAVTAFALAEHADQAVPRLDVTEREEILRKNGALDYVRASSVNDLLK